METTEPLANGAKLPDHPASTTSLKIVKYGKVRDAEDGKVLKCGMHQNEVRTLMLGQQMALTHLYQYIILNEHIYHTRKAVVVEVECE